MFNLKERRVFWVATAVLLILVTAPFLYAQASAGEEYHFSGLLFNPIDGNSYLAKMYEGYRGEWLFTLPYTAEKGQGAFLYTFYLLLGHFARWFGFSLEFVFHAARIISIIFMMEALWRFLEYSLSDSNYSGIAFTWAVFGSGFGLIALLLDYMSSDFWVGEAYPFLTSVANPHFPLSLAIVLYILTPKLTKETVASAGKFPGIWKFIKLNWELLPLSLVLASLSAFGAVLVGLILVVIIAWKYLISFDRQDLMMWVSRAILLLVSGGCMTIYQVLAVRGDPSLASWNAQNITPSPPFWDLLISFGPAIWVAIPVVLFARKNNNNESLIAVVWFVITIFLLWIPFQLQRRFLIGFYIPCIVLAVLGLNRIVRLKLPGVRFLPVMLIVMSLPTNLFLFIATNRAINTHDPSIYLRATEMNVLGWLKKNAHQDDVILAGPILSSHIPAKTGMRVVYGHPFETVDSEARLTEVQQFYAGEMSETKAYDWMQSFGVDYVLIDLSLPAVRILEAYPFLSLKYNHGGTIGIYSVQAAESSSGDLQLE